MKRSLLLCYILGMSPLVFSQSPTGTQNYIMESTPRRAYKTVAAMKSRLIDSGNRTLTYYDGLGRNSQTVDY